MHFAFIDAGQAWTNDPRGLAQQRIGSIRDTTAPNTTAKPRVLIPAAPGGTQRVPDPPPTPPAPVQRWAPLAAAIATDLTSDPDWPMLANTLQRAHDAGYDLHTRLPDLATEQPLPDQRPARELHYRLIDAVPEAAPSTTRSTDAAARLATDQAARQRLQLAAKNSTTATDTADSGSGPEPKRPEDHWRPIVESIDPRLTQDNGWLALAATLQRAAEQGMDLETELPRLIAQGGPLPDRRAAQELQYRVIAAADIAPASYDPQPGASPDRRTRPEPLPGPATTHDRPHGPSR